MKATRILFISGVVLLLAVFFIGIYVVPKLQSGSPATARQSDASRVALSDVFVDATYATPDFVKRVKLQPYLQQWENRAQPFLIGINTHVGTIADLDLRGKILLEDSNGDRFPSMGTPVVLSEHHNMYLLVFPLVDNHGRAIFTPSRGHFRLIVSGVGKTAERFFEWKLPVREPAPVRNVASTLMLVLSVIGALMVILSPCAIELTSYYTGIIAGVVSSAALAQRGSRMPAGVRADPAKSGRIRGRLHRALYGQRRDCRLHGPAIAWHANPLTERRKRDGRDLRTRARSGKRGADNCQ